MGLFYIAKSQTVAFFLCEEKQNIIQYDSLVTKIIMMFFDPDPISFNSFNETK
jgi:hypothetical protein